MVYQDTIYDALGRVVSSSNPYRSVSDSTYGSTSYTYDVLGRATILMNQDGSTRQWCYDDIATNGQSNCHSHITSGADEWVDIADENGNDWQQTTDVSGQLMSVAEPNGLTTAPSLETGYSYDVLGNLLAVSQNGASGDTARSRSFTYDSLSRLLTATNLEVGTSTYTYDANGNVTQKVSPAVNVSSGTQVIGYCYDGLNRVTYKFYSTPPASCTNPSGYVASYAYDSSSISCAANVVGKLTDEKAYIDSTLVSERSPYQYDAMGRLTLEMQMPYAPNSTNYQFLYGYDLAGNRTCANNGFASVTSSSTCTSYTALSNTIGTQYSYDAASHLEEVSLLIAPTSLSTPQILLQASTQTQSALGGAPYDAMGHLVYSQIALKTTSGDAGITTARQYDKRGRILTEADNGALLSSVGTVSTGSISVKASGTEGGLATGTFYIDGSEQMDYTRTYDNGSIALDIGQIISVSVSYGQSSTASGLASQLAKEINVYSQYVTAVASGSSIVVTAKTAGTSGNYALSGIVYSNDLQLNSASFSVGRSGSTMTGGTPYASGSMTVTINDTTTGTVSWTKTSTASSITTAMAKAIQTVRQCKEITFTTML
jgi:YD repeat-containing protein